MRRYLLAAAVLLLDQVTKWLTLTRMAPGESVEVIPRVFHLTRVENTGAAFGMFPGANTALLGFSAVVVVVLAVWPHRISGGNPGSELILGGVLGGAVGNLLDRVLRHRVVDFLDFRVWPVFNLADTAICVGIGLLLLRAFREKHQSRVAGSP